jgi:hypothetical protein
MRALVLAVGLLMSAPAATSAQTPSGPAVVVEAQAFMEGYARDLLAGDRAAIADRYDRSGAWMVSGGQARLVPHEAIATRYRERWTPPSAFEWRDLVFIPSGEDAITVVGRFAWTTAGEPPALLSYHGQFVREDGALRILVEDEALVPAE